MKKFSHKTGRLIILSGMAVAISPVVVSVLWPNPVGAFFLWITIPIGLILYLIARIFSEEDQSNLLRENKQTQLQKEMRQLMWLILLIAIIYLSRFLY